MSFGETESSRSLPSRKTQHLLPKSVFDRPGSDRWNLASTNFPDVGPMVRIHFPPALSPLRTSFSGGKRVERSAETTGDDPDGEYLKRNRWFESGSLQRRVCLSPGAAFEGREPRLSARLCAAGLATGSAETRRVLQDRANRRQYLCRAIFQYRRAAEGVGENAGPNIVGRS